MIIIYTIYTHIHVNKSIHKGMAVCTQCMCLHIIIHIHVLTYITTRTYYGNKERKMPIH